MSFRSFHFSHLFAVTCCFAIAASALASNDSPAVQNARSYLKGHATSGDVYVLYDATTSPSVAFLAITHTRGLLDDMGIPKTAYSVVNTSSLSLAPGLQFHLLVYSAAKPVDKLTVTYAGVTNQAGQPTQATKSMTSTSTTSTTAASTIPTSPPTVVPPPNAIPGTNLYDYTSLLLETPATGVMQVVYGPLATPAESITITKAATWDWSAAFSPSFVLKFDGSPAFGVTALSVPFGTNSSMSIDTVGVFASGSTSSSSLGEALSYSSVIGSSYINSGHDLFGFAVAFKLSFGISGLDFSSHKFGSTPFVGFGFSIPFKTKS